MKKLLPISLIFFSLPLFSINSHEAFLQANEFYRSGEFVKAISSYQQVQNPGGKVNYNLGSCYYHLGKYGEALAYFRRAQKRLGWKDAGRADEKVAELQKKLPDTKMRSSKKMFSFIDGVGVLAWQLMFLTAWLLFWIMLFYRYYLSDLVKSLITFFFLIVALFSVILWLDLILYKKRFGVVVVQSTQFFTGPDKSFSSVGQLKEATEVTILDESDDYFKIKNKSLVGWALKRELIEV